MTGVGNGKSKRGATKEYSFFFSSVLTKDVFPFAWRWPRVDCWRRELSPAPEVRSLEGGRSNMSRWGRISICLEFMGLDLFGGERCVSRSVVKGVRCLTKCIDGICF